MGRNSVATGIRPDIMELDSLIKGCRAVENATASIYRTFMDFFPEEKILWQDLYRDELEHSFWLTDNTVFESIDLLPSRDLLPSKELIASTLDFAQRKIDYIRTNPVTLEEALRIALEIERSMVEMFTNELAANLFSSDYKSLNQKIISAEKLHINKIEDMMISKGYLQLS
jgi:rubrerythrin